MYKTPLYSIHEELHGKMIDADGCLLPVQYSSSTDEHNAVRNNVGIFDLCNMGEFWLTGHDALANLQKLCCQDCEYLSDRQIVYTPMCREDGTIIDDILVFRWDANTFLLIANGFNIDKDYNWIKSHLFGNVEFVNRSEETGTISVQGPNSEAVLSRLTRQMLKSMKYYWFTTAKLAGCECVISRTGFTGEDGFEIYFDAEHAIHLWNAIYEAGKEFGIKPIGLAARDSLRLEARLVHYNKDIDDTTTPFEANLNWTVKFLKGEFIGSETLKKQKEQGTARILVGFEMEKGPAPKKGCRVIWNTKEIGNVTSAVNSPTLKKIIGLCYVPVSMRNPGTKFEIEISHGKLFTATVVETPFYKG